MIRPEELSFPPLHCSLSSELGDYYQDFGNAVQLVESGYHGGLDSDGVATTHVAGEGPTRNPITIAQYALANMTLCRRGSRDRADRARAQLDWLVGAQEQDGPWRGCWLMPNDDVKYSWLKRPWSSSLASGNAISALLRGAEMFADERYRRAGEAAYDGLHARNSRTALFSDDDGELWYEEYPAQPPLHVLNGHVYTLLGVLDFARVTSDPGATKRWTAAANTALRSIGVFDLGYWSAYDGREREPANIHYHTNIHIPLLRILASLTEAEGWKVIADRWEGYAHSRMCRARLFVHLRTRRFGIG